MLIVQECFPFIEYPSRPAVSPRTARIEEPGDALELSWIKGLPGRKRLCFFRGQLFVIQNYIGFKLVRAHILHAQKPIDRPVLKAPSEGLPDSTHFIARETPLAHSTATSSVADSRTGQGFYAT